MNFTKFKKFIFSFFIYIALSLFAFSSAAQAADIQAQLDSSDGSSGFTIENSSGVGKTRIDSNGNVGIGTTGPASTLLYVSPDGIAPTYVGAGDAFVENNLEVDGTAYLNDVYINGLQVNGSTFHGGSSIDTLTVTGNTFLGISAGSNVGIGTVQPLGLLAVGLTPTTQFLVNATGAITAVSGITSTGAYTQTGAGVNSLSGKTTFNAAGTSASFVGNVGIGVPAPGVPLDVLGTIRTTNFTMSGQTPVSGFVLTAADSNGDVTWSSAGGVAGWTVSGANVYETSNGSVGIGTSSVGQGALLVTNGNVGIGTWAPSALLTVGANALTVNNTGLLTTSGGFATSNSYTQTGTNPNAFSGTSTFSNAAVSAAFVNGNVGVGTSAPGAALDVLGTIRTTNFTMSGQTPVSGFVLTASDSNGDVTWSSAGGVAGWTVSGANVYETSNGHVGIGTSSVAQGALLVTNGNVGIGTWAPSAPLTVGANALTVTNTGLLTTSGGIASSNSYTQTGTNPNAFSGTSTFSNATVSAAFVNGNVGVGTSVPGANLDVLGTIRTANFTMTGQTPVSGFVLTASDSNGDATWSTAGSVSGWTTSGNNFYETTTSNTGIGTTTPQGAFVVTNGNVGIGTWAPQSSLIVQNGNVGIGTWVAQNALAVYGTASFSAGVTFNGTPTFAGGGVNFDNTPASNLISLTGNNNRAVPGTFAIAGGVSNTTGAGGTVTITGGAGVGANQNGGNVILAGGAATGVGLAGNVGVGSSNPGQALDVTGTVRATGFTMSGQTPVSGYVLMATDTAGDATWSTAGSVSGWTTSGSNMYATTPTNNVGIGTTTPQGAFVVTNGNVGIGTWAPVTPLQVNGSSENVYITPNGYMGIGTLSPQYSLQVNGVINVSGANNMSINNGNLIYGSNATGIELSRYQVGPENALVSRWDGVSKSYVDVASNSNWNGVTLAAYGGNVGIGSLTPGQTLDVVGTIRATNFTMTGQTPVSGYVLMATDTAGDATWSTAGSVSGWTTSGSNMYETTPTNNVGIGTTTPQGAFVVTNGNVGIGTWVPGGSLIVMNGNVGIGTTAPSFPLVINSTSNDKLLISGSGDGANYSQIALWNNNATPNKWEFSLRQAAAELNNLAWYYGSGNSFTNVMNLTPTGNVGIGTISPQGALVVMNGNVGIGTWVPSLPFEVVATADGANAFKLSQVGNPGNNVSLSDLALTMSRIGSSNGGFNIITTNTGSWGSTPGAGAIILSPNNVAVMTVLKSGNVGIGSSVPSQALDVNGTIRTTGFTMTGQTPVSGYVLMATDTAGDATWSTAGSVSGWTTSGSNMYATTPTNNVGIGTATPQGAFVVTNGNVGIGTWAPAYPLQVYDGTANALEVYTNQGGVLLSKAVTGVVQAPTRFVLYTSNGNVTAMTASNNGNVGIGSTAPNAQLDVEGTLYPTVFNAAFSTSAINVGIGSFAPGQKLDVTGTIRATGFTMTGQTPVSGYVLMATDTAGDATWSTAGSVSGWTSTNTTDVYETNSGNVGIGTTITNRAALTVMNGNVGIGTWAPVSTFTVQGSMAVTVVSKTSNYTVTALDNVVVVNANGGNVAITLPTAASVPGREYIIKKTDNSTNTVSISDGSDTIDGQTSVSLGIQYQAYTIISDGTNWDIV